MSQEEELREKKLLQTRSWLITVKPAQVWNHELYTAMEMAWSCETNSLDRVNRTPKHSFITLLLSDGAVISFGPLPASLLQTSNTSGTNTLKTRAASQDVWEEFVVLHPGKNLLNYLIEISYSVTWRTFSEKIKSTNQCKYFFNPHLVGDRLRAGQGREVAVDSGATWSVCSTWPLAGRWVGKAKQRGGSMMHTVETML